jgi:hypothetical protein
MKIERIDFVAIPSRDAARSAAFYVDTLGLRRDIIARASSSRATRSTRASVTWRSSATPTATR